MTDQADFLSDTSSSDKTIVIENDDIDLILKKYNSEEYKFSSNAQNNFVCAPSSSKCTNTNIYNLDDFSDGDEETNYEPLANRVKPGIKVQNKNISTKSTLNLNEPLANRVKPGIKVQNKNISTKSTLNLNSWQDKFSTNDFCEDSNDFDAVLNRISQLESEQFENEPRQAFSREVETLFSGDIIENPKVKNAYTSNEDCTKKSSRWSGSSAEELSSEHRLGNGLDLKSELEKIKNNIKLDLKSSANDKAKVGTKRSDSSMELSSEDLSAEPKHKKIRKKNSAEKDAQKLEKELAKAAKAKEKEQKKMEQENQKQLKNALKVVENCIKPDQCIQYLTVNIDQNISDKHFGEVIKAGLKSGGYNYIVSKQFVPNLISWTRKVPTIENMFLQNVNQQEKHYMLIIDIPEFIQHIASNTLTGHIQSLLSMSQIEHISIAVLGLQRYYRYLRDEKNRDFKAAVAEAENKRNTNVEFKNLPKVNKKQIEQKLVELQIFCNNIYLRPVEKFEDLATFVGECTKSVAQIPYKTAKGELSQQENECFIVNNRDCVRVDKDGNGLGRLWNQFLRMFPLASLETAEAVSSVYPTIHSLMENANYGPEKVAVFRSDEDEPGPSTAVKRARISC